ncbi:Myo-inositol transporter 1 [Fusarium culmorum]|uniref:Myo-inositol transporter 1 n=1 Tax=Fusarium culmorum TaxID=5516 RepID=A0A2T4GR78_FUSCU|nr:Myo-inositol transporter 1 [Fusarium culmorum]
MSIKEDTKGHLEHLEHSNSPDSIQEVNIDDLDSIEQTQTGKFSWLVSITAAIGGMLFGYDTGIISAVLVYIHQDLGKTLTSQEKELVTSVTSGGAFIGAIFAGATADRYGRKVAIYVGCLLFTVGAIIQAASFSVVQMTVGRVVVGFGVGSAAMIVPLYIAECSPSKYRGRMIGLDNMSITGGQLLSYGVGAAFAHVSSGWRWMVGIGAFPAIILACLLPFCPESPRQLIYHGKPDEAAVVIRRIFPNGTEQQVQDKIQHLTYHVNEAKSLNAGKSGWWVFKQLYVIPANFRALVSACGLMAISQLSGFNSLMYYSPLLFSLVGFSNPVAVGTIIAGTNFIFTWVNLMLVDRAGRRRILLCTVPFMGIFLVIAAVCFKFIPINHDLSLASDAKIGWPAIVVLISMVFFVGYRQHRLAFKRVLPMEVRAMGTMMLTMTCWGSNIIVASTFLTQMENTTPSGAFGFYAAICILGWVCIYFCYPEVKGMTLEDIRDIFQHGFGVQRAREVQKEMKMANKAIASEVLTRA